MPRRDSSPLSQQPHHPYLQGSKELVLWFLNLGRWPFMEEAGCQEANEGEKKNFFLPFAIIYCISPGRFFSFSLLADIMSVTGHLLPPMESVLASFRVHWWDPDNGVLASLLLHSCKMPTKCKKVSVGLWSQELLGTSWTWLCWVYFLPFLSPVMYPVMY